jgi:hypothetical protein
LHVLGAAEVLRRNGTAEKDAVATLVLIPVGRQLAIRLARERLQTCAGA